MADDGIAICESDGRWPETFERESKTLEAALADEDWLAIEHFGSTAIPGLAAKPVIDILIAVESVEAARTSFPNILRPLGYVFWTENPKTDRLFFVKGMPPYGERRTHHIHVCERPSAMWDRLMFRDYLREHPDAAAQYDKLKRELADRFPSDREAYTRGKDDFVAAIMAQAKAA